MIKTKKIQIEVASLTCYDLLFIEVELDILNNKVVDHTVTKINSAYFNGEEIEKHERNIHEFSSETIKEIDNVIHYHKIELEQELRA